MTSYWVLLNQGALKVKAGSYLPTKEPGDCQVSLCHQLPSTGLFSAWVEPLEGFNWASNLWDPWSLGTSSGGPWEKNVPSPSDSNRRVGKKTANGGMVRTQEQWKRRCKHQHISVLHSSLWSLWSLWSSGSLWIKSSPSSAPDLYGWCMPWSRCCRWRSKELVLYGFFVGNPWASDLMQIRSWDGLDRCHEPERCDKLSSHHLDQEWLRAFQLDPCVLSSVPPQWVEDKSPHHRCFGRLAGWASFWGVLLHFWRPWPCGCFECCHQEVSWQSPWCSYSLNGPAMEPNARKLPYIWYGAVQLQRSLGSFRSGRSCQSAFPSSSSQW